MQVRFAQFIGTEIESERGCDIYQHLQRVRAGNLRGILVIIPRPDGADKIKGRLRAHCDPPRSCNIVTMRCDSVIMHTMSLSGNSHVTVAPNVIFQEISGETVLLNLESEKYLGLNEVGTRIWALLQEDCKISDVIAQILTEFDVEEPRLEEDVFELLAQMEAEGLVLHRE